ICGLPRCKTQGDAVYGSRQKEKQVLGQRDVAGEICQILRVSDSRNRNVAGSAGDRRNQTELQTCHWRGLIARGVRISELATQLQRMVAVSPRHAVTVGGKRTAVAEVPARAHNVVGEQDRSDVNRVAVYLRKELDGIIFYPRRLDGRRPIQRGGSIAKSELIQECRG